MIRRFLDWYVRKPESVGAKRLRLWFEIPEPKPIREKAPQARQHWVGL